MEIYRVVAQRKEIQQNQQQEAAAVRLEDHIFRTVAEAEEPLFPSDIAETLNANLLSTPVWTEVEVTRRLLTMTDATQLPDGRWTLKKFVL